MKEWFKQNKGKIAILYAIKIILFLPHTAFATTLIQLPITNGATFYELDTSSIIDNVSSSYTYIHGSDYLASSSLPASINTLTFSGGGSIGSLSNPFLETKVTASVTPFIVALKVPEIDTIYYGVLIFNGSDYEGQTPTSACGNDTRTQILDFNPQDNSTTSSPVSFDISACISPDDIGTIKGIYITLHNIDQNVLLVSSLSPSDIYLLREKNITTSGLFYYSTSTTLGDGNYRIEACIEKSYFFGFVINPFSNKSECISHQFIVGAPTFIGNISQRIFGETNDFLNGLSATSSEALARTCNPVGEYFSTIECLSFLLVPDSYSVSLIVDDVKSAILTRAPIGYVTRFVTIISNPATSTLPTWTASIQVGAGNTETPEIETITIDPADMLAGGASLLESIHDPINNKTPREIFYPMVQLTIAISVLLTIIADMTSSHKHSSDEYGRKGKLS